MSARPPETEVEATDDPSGEAILIWNGRMATVRTPGPTFTEDGAAAGAVPGVTTGSAEIACADARKATATGAPEAAQPL